MPDETLPSVDFESEGDYAIHSETLGLISSHKTATDAIKSFTAHAKSKQDTDAVIYKRGRTGWKVF